MRKYLSLSPFLTFLFNVGIYMGMKESIGIRPLCQTQEQPRVVAHRVGFTHARRLGNRILSLAAGTTSQQRWNTRLGRRIRRLVVGESRLAVICYRNTAMVFA